MLTTNLAIADHLTNSQLGTVTGFKFQQNNPILIVVYVKFDDRKAVDNTTEQRFNCLCNKCSSHYNDFQPLRYAQENILLHKLRELSFHCVWHGHAQYKFKHPHLTNLSLVSNYIDRNHLTRGKYMLLKVVLHQ